MNGEPLRRGMTDVVLCAGVFAFTFIYRFNTLGGAFGGFSNDEFGYLARARQIQAGEWPFRDFNDPGWFLTDGMSALAQSIGGYNLRSQALLTIGMLSLAAGLTFLLARRAAGSYAAAFAAIAIHIGLEPRHYNYPKLVLYAAGILLAWRYVDRPTTGRLAALGGIAGLGFLFRHDHLIYLGAFSLATVAMVHWRSARQMLRGAVTVGLAAGIFVLPFLGFLAVSGGVGEYFRSALVYVERDAQRTGFTLPGVSRHDGQPILAIRREPPNEELGRVPINVRWTTTDAAERQDREARYHLSEGTTADGATWTYVLGDTSRANIESLVRDPLVDDTHGIDRAGFDVTAQERPLRVASLVDTRENATAFLYYTFVLLPVAAGMALFAIHRHGHGPFMTLLSTPAHLVPLLALALLLNAGFLSRGTTNIRLPDVGVTCAILLAWLCSAVFSRNSRRALPGFVPRLAVRIGFGVVLLFTMLSVNTLGQVTRHVGEAGFIGELGVVERATEVAAALAAPPGSLAGAEGQPGVLRLADYVRTCTFPEDRLFVLAEHPELYYFSNRLIAGGHAWLLPRYYSESVDEARIVSRLRAVRVPIVVTEDRTTYDNEYRMGFEQVDAYLRRFYTDAGEVGIGNGASLRVLVRTDLGRTGQYAPLGLPCFTQMASVAAR